MALSFINTSGNIISEDFCSQLLIESKAEYVKSKSFGDDVKKVDEDIATSFELLRERWEEIRSKLLEDEFDTTQLRDRWIKQFLSMLGFVPMYNPHNLKNDAGLEYNIPYRGWDDDEAPLIHMVHSSADFDSRDKNNRTHANKSPHDMLQQFLNTSQHSWAILINGRKVRILRDFFHSITKGFIEFDIEGIFETANTEQFRILYRMMHSSRFVGQFEKHAEDEEKQTCWLEKFHSQSRETGVKVGDNLRKQVRLAIETLGNGFAENLNPDEFDEAKVKKFYSETLNIIYRLLFLLFAEQKGWLPVKNDIYARTYSINALRERAEKADYSHDNNEDLWEGLKVTFRLVTKGYTFPNKDSINAFGGQLFSDDRIFHIKSPLKNKHLLKVVDALCFFTENKLKNKINYATLAIDELGSVYESLLDYEPRLLRENTEINSRTYKRGEFVLDDRSTERKTTGSYYTDSRLVAQLIDSALVPVIENALKDKTTDDEKRLALLDLKVADIACGSGAFLIAALEKLGEYLSLIGKEEGEKPTEQELRHAKREVLQNCIYGVDLNPMALELAKFSLWITASMPNFPLSFLDHRLKCGNSLVGATPELIEKGIPVEAFNPVTLDDKKVCTELKKKVRKELQVFKTKDTYTGVQQGLEFKVTEISTEYEAEQYLQILHSQQEDAEEVENMAHEYQAIYKTLRENAEWKLADTWTAAFFIQKDDLDKSYPTNTTLQAIKQGHAINEDLELEILDLARKYRFFHWHLEFPEVFENGGFDCILGNPPWEKINLEDKEFFASKAPEISAIAKSNVRNKAILKLKQTNPSLYQLYLQATDDTNKGINFYKNSGYYLYGNGGLLNTYPLFTELVIEIANNKGSIGYIIPSGFFNDDTTSPLFRYAAEEKIINNIIDFENKNRLFPSVHRQYRFSLVTLLKGAKNKYFNAMFFLHELKDLMDEKRKVNLSVTDLRKFNPNNFVCPSFKNYLELSINRKLYQYGVFADTLNSTNHSHRMINISTDSNLLSSLFDNHLISLYEAKLFYFYDHRYSTFEDVDEINKSKGLAKRFSNNIKIDPNKFITPRFYAPGNIVYDKNEKWNWEHEWYLAYRVISRSTDERTSIASILPKSVVSNSAYLIFIHNINELVVHMGNMNCFAYDFAVRAKVNVNFPPVILGQCPFINKTFITYRLQKDIEGRVLRLVYNALDVKAFATDLGYDGEPFIWDEDERFRLKCELDAIYGHLYGLSREEFDYILETFPIVKRKDMDKYGTYRTKDTILKLYDEMDWVKEEMEKTKTKKPN